MLMCNSFRLNTSRKSSKTVPMMIAQSRLRSTSIKKGEGVVRRGLAMAGGARLRSMLAPTAQFCRGREAAVDLHQLLRSFQ